MSDKFPLRLVSWNQLDDPRERAIAEIRQRATVISQMCIVIKSYGYRSALGWLDQSLYCFEQNLARWPDGRYYLLNRSYALWRGHSISFSPKEIVNIDGLQAWSNKRFNRTHAASDGFYVLESDSFVPTPRTMREYARLVCEIATAFCEVNR